MRVSARKTKRNKIVTGIFRSAVKKTREAVTAEKVEDAKNWLKAAIKSLDKSAQKGIIKKNTAARKKSRLNKIVKSLSQK